MKKEDIYMFKDMEVIKAFKHERPMGPDDNENEDDEFWNFLMFMRMMGKAIGALEDLIMEIRDFEKAKEKVCYFLLNPAIEELGLSQIPNRLFLDMVIVYAIPMKGKDNKMVATLVNNEMMNSWKVTEKELYEYAKINTPKLLKAKADACLDHSIIKDQKDVDSCLIASNDLHINGSTTIIYDGFLDKIAEENEGFIYVIPYSTEESIIVISNEKLNKEKLYSKLKEEREKMDQILILSSFIYEYNRETKRLEFL